MTAQPPPSDIDILRERANALATRESGLQQEETGALLVVFRCGESLVGIALDTITEVRTLPYHPLPRRDAVLPGVVHLRGRTIALVDLGALLSGSGEPIGDASEVLTVVMNAPEGHFGIRADEILGARPIDPYQLRSVEVAPAGEGLVYAATHEGILLVHLPALFARPEIRFARSDH